MLSLQAFKIDAEEMSHAQCLAFNVHSLKKKKKRKNHKVSHGHMIAHHNNNTNNNTRNTKDDTKNHNTNNNNNKHDNDNGNNHGFNNVVNMNVPPGFRFHPTDEELISFYLTNKVMVVDPMTAPSDITNFDLHRVIPEVDLNKLEPWDLYEKCRGSSASSQQQQQQQQQAAAEWYFFSHKDKKYPTGTRTNRATAAGFWKATGRDKAVHSAASRRSIGMRKTLVFYRGRAPHGTKTDWIMHEYRLQDKLHPDYEPKCNEDGWVVCRVFKKRCLQDKEATTHSNSNMSDEETLTCPQVLGKRYKKDLSSDENETTNPIAHLPCKLEVMEDLPPLQPTFLQLPQLQSSEIASTLSIPMVQNHNKNMMNQPPSLCSDLDPEECDDDDYDDDDDNNNNNSYRNNKPFFMSDDELATFIYNGHFPDGWSMYDTMARYNPELCSFPIDLQQTLYFSKMQPPPIEYPSNCDVDLWNFTR